MSSKRISNCRGCGSGVIDRLFSLGNQSFTGIFPKDDKVPVPSGELDLVKCTSCDLVQLGSSFDLNLLYGQNYGYRSGLNGSMVRHLNNKVQKLLKTVDLVEGDLVIDIGSNDATTLRAYPDRSLNFLGIDPTGEKFKSFYPSDVALISDFFNAGLVKARYPDLKAKVITSFSMFYDLEDPVAFMRDVEEVLHPEGVWVFEQSYLKAMIETNSYDTICHEHLEYYGIKQIVQMAERAGLKVLNIEFNDVNGGSFSVTASKKSARYQPDLAALEALLAEEDRSGLYSMATYSDFAARVALHRKNVREFFDWAASERKRIIGYGASTKGNVLLQYCGITGRDMPCIAEVNEDKFGSFTPGTMIPIVSEAAAKRMFPDYFFVLPWHFKAGILNREKEFQEKGGRFVFPLPDLELGLRGHGIS